MKLPPGYASRSEKHTWKGIVAGAAGGLTASMAMNWFQSLLARLTKEDEASHGAQSNQPGAPHRGIALAMQKRGSDRDDDDATMRLGNAVAAATFDRDLTTSEKHFAGTLIHYTFGIATGAAYGALAEWVPATTVAAGLPMGAFVWATADEGAVPAAGLSRWPGEYPFSTHASALAAHLIYGFTTELVRWSVRKRL